MRLRLFRSGLEVNCIGFYKERRKYVEPGDICIENIDCFWDRCFSSYFTDAVN